MKCRKALRRRGIKSRIARKGNELQHFAETLDYPALRGIDASVEELHGKIGTSSNVEFRRAKWSGPTSLQPAVGEKLAQHRWVVGRTLFWLNRYRRLKIRYERRADITRRSSIWDAR